MYSKPYLKHPTKKLKFHANPTLLAESIWKPKTEKIYNYEGTDGWVLDAERNYEYDIQGNIISDSSDEERTLTRYDSYNNPIEIVKQIHVSNEWRDTEKTVYAYDNVVTDYRIEVTKYIWNGKTKKWEQNYSHKKIITRNSNNYVTRISIMLYNSEEYEEI